MRNPTTNSATDVGFLARRMRTRNPTYKKHIFLVGFSGSGKSMLGPRLARLLKARFYDTDTLIEKRCGKSIAQIFYDDGEAAFRRLESHVIGELLNHSRSRMVMALGGGAFQSRKNRDVVRQHGIVVYLSCSVKEIYRRMKDKTDRPLLRILPAKGETLRKAVIMRIKNLLNQRREGYALADIRVSTTNKSVDDALRELRGRIARYHASH